MSSVRLGFIGAGGNANRHMRELKTIEGTELVAFCDVHWRRRRRLLRSITAEHTKIIARCWIRRNWTLFISLYLLLHMADLNEQ
jgi:predicted homoserine dehydrogenase-like protein